MYRACMFCNGSLGSNQVVEHFPVGRRLAFDAARGRLWVVCRKCERWNLTPIEERWEAIEACDRLFRGTRVRVSTDNVGLARHAEGLELVRIGEPLRPEFAAWRYGDQFGRRRKKAILYTAIGAAAIGGVVVGGALAGISLGGLANLPSLLESRPRAKLRTDDGRVLELTRWELNHSRIGASWSDDGVGFRLVISRRERPEAFEGEEARRLAGIVLPKINRRGGKKETVQAAVDEIERHGHPNAFLAAVVAPGYRFTDREDVPGYVSEMPVATRLAIEMALHEEQERRALGGELWLLERAWKEAEEIAGISDDLLLPEGTKEFLDDNRPTSA